MRMLLVRHGEIISNTLRRLDTNRPGPSLTEVGRQQAASLAERLATESVDVVFRSPLARTGETIEPFLGQSGTEARVIDALAEIPAGIYEGRSDQEARDSYHAAIHAWVGGDLDHQIPLGPDGHEFFDAYDSAISTVRESGADTVVVVSHGAAIRAWSGVRAINLDAEFIRTNELGNTGIVELRLTDAGWVCTTWDSAPLTAGATDIPGARLS